VAGEQLLLQTRSNTIVTTSLEALDVAAFEHMQAVFSKPPSLAEALRSGLHAQSNALNFFEKNDAQGAVNALGDELLEAVGGILPPGIKQTAQFISFAKQWGDQLRALKASFSGNASDFINSGNADIAIGMLSSSLFELSKVATSKLPKRTGAQVATYLASLSDALDGAGESVDLAEEGEQVKGVEALYNGMKAAVNGLVPRNMQDDSTYTQVMKVTDPEMGNVVTGLVGVMRDIVNDRVCWKRTVIRDRERPQACAEGYRLFDERWCMPEEAGVEMQQAACGPGAEARGSWCYLPCPAGYEPKFNHCRQVCDGRFHVNAPLMCGDAQGMIAIAIVQIAAKSGRAMITKEGLTELMLDAGIVAAGSMTAVVEAFADLAEPFGHPKCPRDLTV